MTGDLRGEAAKAGLWWAAIYPLQKVLQLGSNVVLAWLLSPTAFGLVVLANVCVQGLKMLSELGIRAVVVQSRRDDAAFLNTSWTVQVVRGVVLCLLISAVAYPASLFFDEPRLLAIIPALGLMSAVNGLVATKYLVLTRRLVHGRIALLECANTAVSRASMIALALVTPTAWAIVGGSILGAITNVLASHLLLPGMRNRFCWEVTAARTILRFGAWIAVGTFIAFLAQQMDRVLIGKLESLGVLGVYGIAMTIARLPREALVMLSNRVLFPTMSEVARTSRDCFSHKLQAARAVLLPIGLFMTLGVATVAPWLFEMLYDERYAAAKLIAPIGALLGWVQLMNGTASHSLLALGETRALAMSGLLRLIVGTLASIAGLAMYSIPGLMIGMAIGSLAQHAMDLVMLSRRGVHLTRQDIAFTRCSWLQSAVLLMSELVRSTDTALRVASASMTFIVLLAIGAWALLRSLRVAGVDIPYRVSELLRYKCLL